MSSQPPPPIWKTGAEPHEEDMANRGILPKFRPATLGLSASVRPLIRPVKASPAPPVPSPPRRIEPAVESQAAIETERFDDDPLEMVTDHGVDEPATSNHGPATVPRETVQATPRGGRGNVMQMRLDDETRARPVTIPFPERHRDAIVTPVRLVDADLGVDYDALPSLEVPTPYEADGGFPEQIGRAHV